LNSFELGGATGLEQRQCIRNSNASARYRRARRSRTARLEVCAASEPLPSRISFHPRRYKREREVRLAAAPTTLLWAEVWTAILELVDRAAEIVSHVSGAHSV